MSFNQSLEELSTPFCDGVHCEELERFAALVAAEKDKEIERLREGNVYPKEALWAAANRIEKLAFQLPAPNKQTPEFMMLAISIRKIVQGQEQPR